MKAEERKELKQNTLVATVEKVGHALKQGPSRRSVVVVGILLLLVLLYAVWQIATNISEGRNSKRNLELLTAGSPEDLKQLIDKQGDTIQGRAARLQLARQNLIDGLGEGDRDSGEDRRGILSDYKSGAELLRRAAESFEKLAKEYKATPVLVQECYYGAGQAREALGELDEAVRLYEEVGKASPKNDPGPLAEQAAKAAQRVKDRKAELDKIQQQLKKS